MDTVNTRAVKGGGVLLLILIGFAVIMQVICFTILYQKGMMQCLCQQTSVKLHLSDAT